MTLDHLITAATVEFVARGGQCFDWTPSSEKCPRCRVDLGGETSRKVLASLTNTHQTSLLPDTPGKGRTHSTLRGLRGGSNPPAPTIHLRNIGP